MESLSASFNGIELLSGDARRCQNCGNPHDKWKAPLSCGQPLNCDFSLSRDGYWIASHRFRAACDTHGITGSIWRPLAGGMYAVVPQRIIAIRQALSSRTPCALCGIAAEFRVEGPPRLAPDAQPPGPFEMTRSDLEYGPLKMRHFCIWVGADAAARLRTDNLRGLQFALQYAPGAAPTYRLRVARP